MRPKFKIFLNREEDDLHMRLIGEFTDVSICELIDVLKNNCHGVKQVFIHTGKINQISTSIIGRDVFYKNLHDLNDNSISVQFTGGCDHQFIPENCMLQ